MIFLKTYFDFFQSPIIFGIFILLAIIGLFLRKKHKTPSKVFFRLATFTLIFTILYTIPSLYGDNGFAIYFGFVLVIPILLAITGLSLKKKYKTPSKVLFILAILYLVIGTGACLSL